MNVKNLIPLLFVFLISLTSAAQYKGQLRGLAVEQLLQQPLSGATVTLSPLKRTVITDAEGLFRFTDIPVGTYSVTISYAGFKEVVLENIQVNSGKETVLNIPMEAVIKAETEVVLQVNSKKNKPLNEMNAVSARAFTVEETQKYAAAVNDPLRMAVAFPGVMAGDDGNNSIIIRGNSPVGLLWRMEGLDIPNPNHFAMPGNSGGGISILSAQVLANSDFVTAAFAAEYGNAVSGVFDLHLRKGNNEKREYSLQAGVLGLNASLEGPFSKKYKGSYLVNYRYSTLSLLTKMGVLDDNGITNFQDLSYNIHLPAGRAGNFTLFGFNGRSDQFYEADKDSSKWETRSDRYSFDFFSHASMNGMTHTIKGNKWNLKTGIGLSSTRTGFKEHMFMDDLTKVPTWLDKYITRKWVLNSTINYKFSKQLLLRAGIIGTLVKYTVNQSLPDHDGDPLELRINTSGNSSMQQAFAQAQFRPSEKITLQAGMHYLRVALNKSNAAEPRASLKWNINKRSGLAFGYGMHSQAQTWGLYFVQQEQPDG
ncbi:MAG TPA: carboxypeptidase-like regulatory domain-containing protein, partial [Chitinophagaceae bacterium]|nr:carboxypeptidase-like regulatory domain-containing protein [Chitinophagaceae bacterium]